VSDTRTSLNVEEYRVMYDDPAYPASNASCAMQDGVLWMTLQEATDGDLGHIMRLTRSSDMGRTWSTPEPFGPPVDDLHNEFQSAHLMSMPNGTLLSVGTHRPLDAGTAHKPEGIVWRPSSVQIGKQQEVGGPFTWSEFPSGTFMGEQFAYPGLVTRNGRLVLSVWGAKEHGENWRCGVLLSDDEGETFRYRDVAYEADLAIRLDPHVTAGYNEQTLMETPEGLLVSIIRGRDRLGAIEGSSPSSSEAWFAHCESHDGGETWSEPTFTNLPGTGAAWNSLTLPDGSLLLGSRLPTTWSRHDGYALCGLHLGRSYDSGRTWQTELVFWRDPEGVPYDNYYNAMNGQWVQLEERRAMYVFGYFQHRQNRHRVNSLTLSWR
jgi:hypothetical protein